MSKKTFEVYYGVGQKPTLDPVLVSNTYHTYWHTLDVDGDEEGAKFKLFLAFYSIDDDDPLYMIPECEWNGDFESFIKYYTEEFNGCGEQEEALFCSITYYVDKADSEERDELGGYMITCGDSFEYKVKINQQDE